jgi:hypothetical protein
MVTSVSLVLRSVKPFYFFIACIDALQYSAAVITVVMKFLSDDWHTMKKILMIFFLFSLFAHPYSVQAGPLHDEESATFLPQNTLSSCYIHIPQCVCDDFIKNNPRYKWGEKEDLQNLTKHMCQYLEKLEQGSRYGITDDGIALLRGTLAASFIMYCVSFLIPCIVTATW